MEWMLRGDGEGSVMSDMNGVVVLELLIAPVMGQSHCSSALGYELAVLFTPRPDLASKFFITPPNLAG